MPCPELDSLHQRQRIELLAEGRPPALNCPPSACDPRTSRRASPPLETPVGLPHTDRGPFDDYTGLITPAASTPATSSIPVINFLRRGVSQAGARAASHARAPVTVVAAAAAPITHCAHMPTSLRRPGHFNNS